MLDDARAESVAQELVQKRMRFDARVRRQRIVASSASVFAATLTATDVWVGLRPRNFVQSTRGILLSILRSIVLPWMECQVIQIPYYK